MGTRERWWGKWSCGLLGLCSTSVTPETDKALQPWTKWGGGTMLEKDASQPATTQNTKQMLPNLAFLKTVRSSGWA